MKPKSKYFIGVLLFCFAGLSLGLLSLSDKPSSPIRVKIADFPGSKKIDITVEGKLFTSYLYSDSLKKPALFPVIAADDISVTRGFPLATKGGETTDHPHHTGFWFGYGYVNGIDFWGNSSWIPASEKSRYGIIRLKSIDRIKSDSEEAVLELTQEWVNPDGTIPLEEHVVFTFRAGKNYRVIDRVTTLTAELSDVAMNDTKEGAFAIRVARFLDLPSNEPKVFTDQFGKPTPVPVLNNEGATGNYLSSEGFEGEKVWGTRARWMELFGINASDTVSLVFMDHPSNLNYPTYWHARGYGLFSANPFGVKDFTAGKEVLNFKLKKGESLTFKHRIYIKSGNSLGKDEIDEEWNKFSKN